MIGSIPHGIRSRRIVTPDGVRDGVVLIENGRVESVISSDGHERLDGLVDLGNLALLPGFVDTHVHINEPGRTEWEGFDTATKAAAAGGITTLVDMPLNSLPVTTTVAALKEKMASAMGNLHVDCGFYGGLVPDNLGHLPSLIEAGVLGIKAFMVDSGIVEFPAVGLRVLREGLKITGQFGVPLLAHAEIEGPANKAANPRDYSEYAASRPQAWEEQAVAMLIEICREFGAHVHIVHLAASNCLPAIRKARSEGLPITVETCPHYLFFDESQIADGDTLFKCAPPIRDSRNRDLLRQALVGGDIDFVASDHSPSPPSLKMQGTGNFGRAWGGVSSLELGASIVWTLTQGRESGMGSTENPLESLARWMSFGPSRLVGLNGDRGGIVPGKRADLAVFDPEAERRVDAAKLYSRHPVTPYHGLRLAGVVRSTFLSGRCIYHNGTFLDEPLGRCVMRGPGH